MHYNIHLDKIKLPDRKPYEGKATRKQKNLLWSMGIEDEEYLDTLGKEQIFFLIDAIKKIRKGASSAYSYSVVTGVLTVIFVIAGFAGLTLVGKWGGIICGSFFVLSLLALCSQITKAK